MKIKESVRAEAFERRAVTTAAATRMEGRRGRDTHRIHVILRLLGPLHARRTTEEMLFEVGQFLFLSYHSQVVPFQIVIGDVLGVHVYPGATRRGPSHFCSARIFKAPSLGRSARIARRISLGLGILQRDGESCSTPGILDSIGELFEG
jgi:hypothetical protein